MASLLRDLDQDLLNRKRLMIMTILYVSGPKLEAELMEALGLSWGDLDSNLRRLKERGYAVARKVLSARGPRTSVSITRDGAAEYRRLVRGLDRVLRLASSDEGLADATDTSRGRPSTD